MDLTATSAVLAAAVVLFAYGSWRAAQPADPLRPRVIPWRPLLIACGAVAIFMVVHLLNLLGVQTDQPRQY
jgi:hypothetical protein